MQSDLPKTVNEALKILAYNDYFWSDESNPAKMKIKPHPKDFETIKSLAEAQYAWTEKQAKLAVVLLKRYLTKFQAHGMDIKPLLDNPQYEEAFRVINFAKTIEKYTDEENVTKIEVKFPYNKKVIQLIRNLKDKKDLPGQHALYDGESKIWTFIHTDVTAYYLTLIAVRYDFKFITPELFDDFDEIRKEIKSYKKPSARLENSKVILDHAPDSLKEYWDQNIKDLPTLHQVDTLKNLGISTTGIKVHSDSVLAGKIAHNPHHKLWLSSNNYTKAEVVKALFELNAFPLVIPCHSDIHEEQEIKEFWEWLKVFEKFGIDIMKQVSWGFDLKEPIYKKDLDNMNERKYLLSNQNSREFFENLYELHQMSKQFKFIDDTTKIIFVRNRIPRAMIKSEIKPRASLIALNGGYYASGTENLKRLLENLPKKLYYSDYQPSSWDWNDRVIEKL